MVDIPQIQEIGIKRKFHPSQLQTYVQYQDVQNGHVPEEPAVHHGTFGLQGHHEHIHAS